MLRELFDTAGVETLLDESGRLRVADGVRCYVIPATNGRRIYLQTTFQATDFSTWEQRLELANRINDNMAVLRCSTRSDRTVTFDHYIMVEGGIRGANIVQTTRFFLTLLRVAIRDYDTENVLV